MVVTASPPISIGGLILFQKSEKIKVRGGETPTKTIKLEGAII